MNFTTLPFFGFLLVAVVAYRFCPLRLRCVFLLLASYGFYLTWSKPFAVFLFVLTAIVFFVGRRMELAPEGSAKKLIMMLSVGGLVAVLVAFKCLPWLQEAFKSGFGGRPLSFAMPLGVSYYSFKLISYLVDIYWGTTKAEQKFIPFATYVVFFPQIVAGPIQRSESFLPQVQRPGLPSGALMMAGVQRLLLGYFKKFVVADNLSVLVDFIYSHLHGSPGTPVLLGFYGYPLQLYADFSGLTDFAVGAALLFGIKSPENFNAPFSAVNPTDYWRRWHITLTQWLTDYVFTPLRMSVRAYGNAGLVFSLVVLMVLIGLWHGFRWNFVLFGLVHAFYLSVDALTVRKRKAFYKVHPEWDRRMNWIGPIVTFHLVAFGLVFFRAPAPGDVLYVMTHLFDGLQNPSGAFADFWAVSQKAVYVGFGAYIFLEIGDYIRRRNQSGELILSLPSWGRWSMYSCTALLTIFVLLVLLAADAKKSPFIYAAL